MKNHSNVPQKTWIFHLKLSSFQSQIFWFQGAKKKNIVPPRRWIDQHDVSWSFGMQLRVYHNIYSIYICITNIYTHISSTDYSTTQNRFLQKKRYKRCSNLSLEKNLRPSKTICRISLCTINSSYSCREVDP